MDITLLVALGSVVVLIILGVLLFLKTSTGLKPDAVARERGGIQRAEDAPRRAQVVRNQRARLRANAARQEQAQEDNEVVDEPIEGIDDKMGAKKRAKLEAKAEKKAQREMEERAREDKKKKEQQADEERMKQQEKDHAEEKRQEEEERKAREEKERREYEEYLKMKEAFSVEEEGYEEGESENEKSLQDFINYIKENKVIVIEDLAAHFKLKTQAAIERIQDLQKDNTISGVIDDRGKFIYVSQEELESVAKFIRQRGRVSLTELAECSNKLINLNPSKILVT
ncbi:uncharacterized protein CBL_12465 [Carabus blaptoides fortunei]